MSTQDTLKELQATYRDRTKNSRKIWEENKKGLIDGVGSQPRFVKPHPLAIDSADGSKIWDVDGNEYIDVYNCFGGVSMLGHSAEPIKKSIEQQLDDGSVYGFPYETQIEYVNQLKDRYPVMDQLRLSNSGTEANLNAIRLARSYTGRDKIVKIEGSYHGSFNDVFISTTPSVDEAGPSKSPIPRANGAGIPDAVLDETLIAPFNDPDALSEILDRYGGDVAAIILEAVPLYGTLIEPTSNYFSEVRSLASEYGAVFILDEVKTGCRIAYGGATEYYNIEPDIVTLGKAISGGVAGGAFGGKEEIMLDMSFQGEGRGRTENVGTYNANPLLVNSGLASFKQLTKDVYDQLDEYSERIENAIRDIAYDEDVTLTVQSLPSLGYIHFGVDNDINDYRSGSGQDFDTALKYWFAVVNEGMLPPAKTSAWYLTAAHTESDIDNIIEINKKAFENIF